MALIAPLRLTGRSSSHYTRVVRMFADELAIPLALEVVHDLMGLDAAAYGGHPALKLPTLHVGGVALFGTEHLCRRLAELAGRADDPRVVLPHQLTSDLARNAQELIWHAMAAQVQLVVGLRVARLPADNVLFVKAAAGLSGALDWLDARLDDVLAALPAPRDVSVLEVTLFCLLEHIVFRPTAPLDALPNLRAFATGYAARGSAQRTPFLFDPAPAPQESR